MAASAHLGIRNAVAGAFAGLAGGRIRENRDLPLADGVPSQIAVYRVRSIPESPELLHPSAPIDWTTDIRVVIRARKSGADTGEAIADDLACSCYAAIFADPSLGGVAQNLFTGGFAWDQDEADSNVVVVVWDLTVQHRTQARVIT